MKVTADILKLKEPQLYLHSDEHVICMLLQPALAEGGLRRSSMVTYDVGEMGLWPGNAEKWVRNDDAHVLTLGISDAALAPACDGANVELGCYLKLADARVQALVGGGERGKGCRISEWAAVSRFGRTGDFRSAGGSLRCKAPSLTDIQRRTNSRTLATNCRHGAREPGE
jgi:hypothetical protein